MAANRTRGINFWLREDFCRAFNFIEDTKFTPYNSSTDKIKNGPNLKLTKRGTKLLEDRSTSSYQFRYYQMATHTYTKDIAGQGMTKPAAGILFYCHKVNFIFGNTKRLCYKNGSGTRMLQVYSSLGEPVRIGDQITDLLAMIPHTPRLSGTSYYEPPLLQYVPLRNNAISVIEIEVGESAESMLARFTDVGDTIVTLTFKRVK